VESAQEHNQSTRVVSLEIDNKFDRVRPRIIAGARFLCAVGLQFRTQFDPASDILPEIQSQDFFHLQPVSTGAVSPFNLLDLELRVARLIGPFPGRCRENDATSWFGVLIFLDRLLQAAAPSAPSRAWCTIRTVVSNTQRGITLPC
jgi:hypothetical protein